MVHGLGNLLAASPATRLVGYRWAMMIHRKISGMAAVDGRVVIEADGNNHSVEVDIGGIESVTLRGDLAGSLVVSGDADCDAVRSGRGDGDVLRYGDGNGKASPDRVGQGERPPSGAR